MSSPRYGKFRARVISVQDPQERGRVKVTCPKVMGQGCSAWCEICVPCAYDGGGDFFLPKVGDTVWIEFEEGDPTKPIWVGSWWSTGKSSNKNYAHADKLRVIEFNGCRIEMQEGQMKLSVGSSQLVLNLNGATVESSGTTNVKGGVTNIKGTSVHLN